jgi:hypothetical protein
LVGRLKMLAQLESNKTARMATGTVFMIIRVPSWRW